MDIQIDTPPGFAGDMSVPVVDASAEAKDMAYPVSCGPAGHWMQDQKLSKKGLSPVSLTSEMAPAGEKDPS